MKAWFGDLARLLGALLYWNVRKTLFVLRGRTGRGPCQNPSDSGRPGETGCEAAAFWRERARFRRVCPLLVQNAGGAWKCGVAPAGVRPFWGRAAAWYGGIALALALAAGAAFFGGLRLVGYHVQLRQVFWPPAWRELRGVRAELFVRQAQAHYAAGRIREAVAALTTAYELDPGNYAVGLTLAQYRQAANPATADDLYRDLLRRHPENRRQTARAWFGSLLAHGRLAELAALAGEQLAESTDDAAVWTHAVIFAARRLGRPELLEQAAARPGVPAAARAALVFEARLRRLPRADAVQLLRAEPPPAKFPYGLVQRAELFLEFGQGDAALAWLVRFRSEISGRDLARLVLAAYATGGREAELRRQAEALFPTSRPATAAEVSLLALHLVGHPDAQLLDRLDTLLARMEKADAFVRAETICAVLFACGVQRDSARFDKIASQAVAEQLAGREAVARAREFFFPPNTPWRIGSVLPLFPVSVEEAYAMIARYSLESIGK